MENDDFWDGDDFGDGEKNHFRFQNILPIKVCERE